MNYERTPRERTPEQQRARMEPDRFYRPFNVPVVRQTTHPMTRIDEIRARKKLYEHNWSDPDLDQATRVVRDMVLTEQAFTEDIPYLLSEVTRLSGLVEDAEIIMEDNEHLDKRITGWLESVQGEDTP